MRLFSKSLCLIVVGVIASSAALAQRPSPEQQAINARQAVFTLISSNQGPLGAMIRGRAPFDAEVATKNLTRISQLSLMITDTFALDTRSSEIETDALDSIWDNMDDFASKAEALTNLADSTLAALAAGDEDEAKKILSGLGRTCGGCHDDYRAE